MADVAVIACTSKGSIQEWMQPQSACIHSSAKAGNEQHCQFGLGELSSAVAREINATDGIRLTLSAACASGLHGLIRGTIILQTGQARRVLVVAAEASVHPLFLASFKRLGVFPADDEVCRPFDQYRSGFLMSEASAAVCLEATANDCGVVRVDRFAMGADATHLTGSDAEARVLRSLLGTVVENRAVDLIHAHGTGTISNDATELAAIEATTTRTVGNSRGGPPVLFSHKGALGHSLGASGLVAVVLNCLAHQHDIVPGNIHTRFPMVSQAVRIHTAPIHQTVRRSIVTSAGFGGALGVVSLVSV